MWTDQLHSTSAAYEDETATGSPRKKEGSPVRNVDVSTLLDEDELNGAGWNKPA